jgi:membrane fusion protein (multidrug efflux system)
MHFHSATYVIIIALVMLGCGSKTDKPAAPQGPPPVSVATQQVQVSDAAYYHEYPAVVRALNEVELRAQVNGYITGIHFQEGQQIKKGQKLYTIDQQQYQAAYQQALANLETQEANLLKAKKDVERYRELDKADAIAKQQVDYAEATYAAAQKQVDAARAVAQSVQTNVRYSTIVAPFDGTIGISSVRLGSAISAGQTLLNTISSDDPMAADIIIAQQEIFQFSQLLARQSKAAANDSTFRLAFGDDVYPSPGKISTMDRAVDPQTSSLRVRLTFPNHEHLLRAGMSGTLRVLNVSSKAIIIPFKAVTEQLGEYFVYVPAEGNKVTQRKVVLGQQIGKNVIIQSGLKEGETIVTEGVQNLREGSSIAVAQPGQAPAQTK